LLVVDELDIFPRFSRLPTSSIRSSPPAHHKRSSLIIPIQPSRRATSSTTPPLLPHRDRLWKLRIFLLAAKAFAKAIRASLRSEIADRCADSDQAPLCDDIPHGGVRRVTPQRRCRRAGVTTPALGPYLLILMFNFSANHLLLLPYGIPLVRIPHEGRLHSPVYRLTDFKSKPSRQTYYYCCRKGQQRGTNSTWSSSRSGGTPSTPDPQLRLSDARENRHELTIRRGFGKKLEIVTACLRSADA